ncbi:hypothetical protein STSP2_00217 [Anaerohalosphaera lusitana]|uniref:UVR domain-containing protein n=1 Tax=Anaerohalosphaera lusitana TaxID=1936003 RepID=A0A1U9NH32_9BACT|nr:UvrB/UvrC motif-containing protein [Anaerohalosphaera lusitana]AQT67077.1 hypothetical protein STSP2_00217 [Anaerohalosphaera lusitana]
MQCQLCKQNMATIHLTEISNGQRSETHLCEDCAQQQGLSVKAQIPLNELLSTLLASQPEAKEELTAAAEDADLGSATCPACGMTLDRFKKESLLGCPHDYEAFEDQLNPLIEKTQNGRTTHSGKVPEHIPEDNKTQIELINLRRRLEEAVKLEDYETAAEIRDKINHLQ